MLHTISMRQNTLDPQIIYSTNNKGFAQRITQYIGYDVVPRSFEEWLIFILVIYAGTYTAVGYSFDIVPLMQRKIYKVVLLVSACIYLIRARKQSFSVPGEVKLFIAWLVWCVLGQIDQGTFTEAFWGQYRDAAATFILFFMTARVAIQRNLFPMIFFGFVIVALVMMGSTLCSGELLTSAQDPSWRLGRTASGNPNYFGHNMILAFFGVVYFLKNNKTTLRTTRIFQIILLFTISIGIILSQSRKVFIGTMLFIPLCLVFWYGKSILLKPRLFITTLVIISIMAFSLPIILERTSMGQRFQMSIDEREDKFGQEDRYEKWEESVDLVQQRPICGFGIGNFYGLRLSRSGRAEHSEYVGIITETGIVGFVLYFSMFVVLLRRLNRIGARVRNDQIIYTVGLLKTAIIVILVMSIARHRLYASRVTYAFIGCAAGFSWSIAREQTFQIAKQSQAALEHIMPGRWKSNVWTS